MTTPLAASGGADRSEAGALVNRLPALIPGAEDPRLLRVVRIKQDVWRLHFAAGGRLHAVVAKRTDPQAAARNRLVSERWLPAVGLEACGPQVAGILSTDRPDRVWQIAWDLGDLPLRAHRSEPASVAAAVTAIARLHQACAEHPLLAECRAAGNDYGPAFFGNAVAAAVTALGHVDPPPGRAATRDRLLRRLHALLDEEPARMAALQQHDGPLTLVHGDLWLDNVLVIPAPAGPAVRLIDWDKVGVGSPSYDLSTLAARFPRGQRRSVLDAYAAAGGWRAPDAAVTNLLFDTAERARLAHCTRWAARAVLDGEPEWGYQELTEIDRWFRDLRPLLPTRAGEPA